MVAPVLSGRLVGYARVSSDDQDLSLQIDSLTGLGINRDDIFIEKVSGACFPNSSNWSEAFAPAIGTRLFNPPSRPCYNSPVKISKTHSCTAATRLRKKETCSRAMAAG
jgi:hypothetical protein